MTESSSIPVYKIPVSITGSELVLSVGGDYHYGVRNVSADEILRKADLESKKHNSNIFRIFTGDLIENALKSSIGHNYDIEIPDPQEQKDKMIELLTQIMSNQYGEAEYKKLKIGEKYKSFDLSNCRAAGVCGNHEYRSRKLSGQWIDREMYGAAKILSMGMQGILELNVINKKLKLNKTYRIYVAHRPSSSSSTSTDSIMRSIRKKRSDVPGCDLYVFGHFHKKMIVPDGQYDADSGEYRKILYVVNPSPMYDAEYADVANFSPLVIGHSVEVFLPIDSCPYGIV